MKSGFPLEFIPLDSRLRGNDKRDGNDNFVSFICFWRHKGAMALRRQW